MKKHLFGAILFSGIVGVAVFVNLFAIPELLPVYQTPIIVENKSTCYPELSSLKSTIGIEDVKITEAFYSKNSKEVYFEISEDIPLNVEVKIFYQQLATSENPTAENVNWTTDLRTKSSIENRKQVIKLSGDWVNRIKPTDTMYITLERVGDFSKIPILMIPIKSESVPVPIISAL